MTVTFQELSPLFWVFQRTGEILSKFRRYRVQRVLEFIVSTRLKDAPGNGRTQENFSDKGVASND